MKNNIIYSLKITNLAFNKINSLILSDKRSNLGFRIYVTGGGCNGFKYGFLLDNFINKYDIIILNKGISLIVDSMSLQYLIGSCIDYIEDLSGSRFIVINSKNKCSCGLSFSI